MRNKWLAYAASLMLTAVLVASSMFLPRLLLARQESGMLDVEYNHGISQYQSRLFPRATLVPSPSPSSSSTAPTAAPGSLSVGELARKIDLYQNSGEYRTAQREPAEGEMSMKQAVKLCITQIEEYTKGGMMLGLPDFPNDYTMGAVLYTIRDNTGAVLDYWSISFTPDPKITKTHSGIGLTMDAQTGTILSFKMYTDRVKPPELTATVTAIASRLNLEGSFPGAVVKQASTETVTWVSANQSLYINLMSSWGDETTSLAMTMTTQPIR